MAFFTMFCVWKSKINSISYEDNMQGTAIPGKSLAAHIRTGRHLQDKKKLFCRVAKQVGIVYVSQQ